MAHEMDHLVLCIRVDFFESSNPTRKHLIKKVRLEHLEEEIIDLWHYVYALRLRLKDD